MVRKNTDLVLMYCIVRILSHFSQRTVQYIDVFLPPRGLFKLQFYENRLLQPTAYYIQIGWPRGGCIKRFPLYVAVGAEVIFFA